MKTKTVLTHIGPGSLRSQAEVPGTVTACTLCNLGESAEQPVGGRDSWSWCWALRHSPGGGSEDTIRRASARVRKWESLTVRTRSVPGGHGQCQGTRSVLGGYGQCQGDTVSARGTQSVQGGHGQCRGDTVSARGHGQCWGDTVSARGTWSVQGGHDQCQGIWSVTRGTQSVSGDSGRGAPEAQMQQSRGQGAEEGSTSPSPAALRSHLCPKAHGYPVYSGSTSC